LDKDIADCQMAIADYCSAINNQQSEIVTIGNRQLKIGN
jgi:hypothetical protein